MENYFYDLPRASKRRNRYIFPSDGTSLNIINLPELFAKARLRVSSSTYIYPGLAFSFIFLLPPKTLLFLLVESDSIPMSLFVIADLDSLDGLELIKEALGSLVRGFLMSIIILPCLCLLLAHVDA
jgi:UDP-glucose:glycoprotein glucosyltransferase